MRILLACEESQLVTIAFREKGHEAFSCDIIPCSGGHPEWHYQMDVFKAIEDFGPWDMMIAFPPCTYLSSVQTFICRNDPHRVLKRINAAEFFMKLMVAKVGKIAIENPTGIMTHIFRPPDQVVHPFFFGDNVMKRTCLWVKNLPLLYSQKQSDLFSTSTYGNLLPPKRSYIQKSTGKVKLERHASHMFKSGFERSKISNSLAKAMAEQWG